MIAVEPVVNFSREIHTKMELESFFWAKNKNYRKDGAKWFFPVKFPKKLA